MGCPAASTTIALPGSSEGASFLHSEAWTAIVCALRATPSGFLTVTVTLAMSGVVAGFGDGACTLAAGAALGAAELCAARASPPARQPATQVSKPSKPRSSAESTPDPTSFHDDGRLGFDAFRLHAGGQIEEHELQRFFLRREIARF